MTTITRARTRVAGDFQARYEAAVSRNDSLLCIGLDPDQRQLPPGLGPREFLIGVVEATADLVCCYKPNSAFYEQYGDDGWAVLRDVIAAVPRDIPVLLDAKRGDVGHTAAAYAEALYEWLGADAVTLNPYLGIEALEPFLEYEDRTTFVVCRTSNPGAGELQDIMAGEQRIYEHVAALAKRWNVRGNVGLVVGATYPEEAARVRAICPDQPILLPGIGAQAGDVAAAVRSSVDGRGGGILVSASRSALYSPDGVRQAAEKLRTAINASRTHTSP